MSSSSSPSREYSPDWLRNTPQAPPTTSILTSSTSESIPPTASDDDDDDDQLPISSVINKTSQVKSPTKKRNNRLPQGTNTLAKEPKSSVWTLSSDSEYEQETAQQHPKESSLKGASSPLNKRLKVETKLEIDGNIKVLESETTEKQTGPYISSSRLPLLLADKVQRSKALVECEGESIDLSGDLGSVGRVVISDSPSGDQDIFLDLKGTIYKTTIIPSRTFCVVSFGPSEAKIEAIMNDFIQLKPQSNVYEAETMVEGTLEGFSFDSEDEADNHTIRQTEDNEGPEPQNNGKGRGKAEKLSGSARKKGKTAVKKPAKKVKRKAPAAKKTKTKK